MGSKFGTVTIENHLPVPITNSRLTQTVPDILISGTEQINPGQRKVIEIPEVAGKLLLIRSDKCIELTDTDFQDHLEYGVVRFSLLLGYLNCCLADSKGVANISNSQPQVLHRMYAGK